MKVIWTNSNSCVWVGWCHWEYTGIYSLIRRSGSLRLFDHSFPTLCFFFTLWLALFLALFYCNLTISTFHYRWVGIWAASMCAFGAIFSLHDISVFRVGKSQDTLRPVYWILQDRRLNALVIAVRGTFSMSDFVSDLSPGCELVYSVGWMDGVSSRGT